MSIVQRLLESARNGIVLLKNDGVLPLDASRYKKIMVTGINADDQNIWVTGVLLRKMKT